MTTTQKKTPAPVKGEGAGLDTTSLVESVARVCPTTDGRAISLTLALAYYVAKVLS